jgi:hypothetical protein
MKHLLWVIGILALAPAIYYFSLFYKSPENQGTEHLIFAGIFFAVSLVCWAIFFFMKFRAEGQQDISITKF